jgi:hypothetical protein
MKIFVRGPALLTPGLQYLFPIFIHKHHAMWQGSLTLMRKTAVSGLVAISLAIGLAGVALLLKTSPASSEDFCFGYAVCDQTSSR